MSTPAAPRPPRGTFLRAFAFAGAGLADAALRERNLRVHLALGTLAACAAAVLELAVAERAVVLVCIGAVVAAETFNSAVEVIVDALFPGLDERARFAKDAAAGAVLALAATSVAAGAVVLGPAALAALAALRPGEGGRLAIPAAAAAVAALSAGRLPGARTRAALGTNLAVAAATIGLVARSARGPSGVVVAALLVVLAAGAGGRALARRGPPGHARRSSS